MRIRVIILILLLVSIGKQAKSTHVVGGDLTYLYIGNNNYEITLKLYVDCVNGSSLAILQDSTAIVVVYDTAGNLIDSLGIRRSDPVRVEALAYSCVIPPTNACVDLYVYKDTINLPPIPGGYTMAFQRCCRNRTLNNIVNPLSTGSTYWTYIPDTTGFGFNSSPVFDSLPPNFLCVNNPLVFDHGATDPDGDSLVYELCVPFDGNFTFSPRPPKPPAPPYPNVTWLSPYSSANVMGGAPILDINAETGLLTVTPNDLGQFVVGLCVKEYRDGVMIGRTMRDYQLNVLNCNFTVVSSFASPSLTCSRNVFFNNFSSGADSYMWDFGVPSMDSDTSLEYTPTYTYPDTGNFNIMLIARSGNCIDTFETPIHVVDKIDAYAGNDTSICIGDTIQLGEEDFSNFFSYQWTGSGLTVYNKPDPKTFTTVINTYIVTKTRGNCEAKDTVTVTVLNPIAGVSPRLTCNKEVPFINSSTGATAYYWDFGDDGATNDTSHLETPTYTYTGAFNFTVTLTAINGECRDTATAPIKIIGDYKVNAGNDTFLCNGEGVILGEVRTNPDDVYKWVSEEYIDTPNNSKVLAVPETNITYIVTKTTGVDCEAKDTVSIVINTPIALFDTTTESGCEGVDYAFTNNSEYAHEYKWIFSNGQVIDGKEIDNIRLYFDEHVKVSLVAKNKDCVDTFEQEFIAPSLFLQYDRLPNVFTPGADGFNDCFRITDDPKLELCYELIVYNRWGEIVFRKPEDGMCWDGNVPQTGKQVPHGTYYYIFRAGGKETTGTITVIR